MKTLYIHELPDWPEFRWNQKKLAEPLAIVRHQQGRLIGRMEGLGFRFKEEAVFRTLTQDVLKTNEIEGEILNAEQVRSSLARRLGLDIGGLKRSDRHVPTEPGQTFVYIAGLPVTELGALPEGMVSCTIPKAKYAVFTHKSHLDNLPNTINYIWGTWIPKNIEKYHHTSGPDFELYDSRFNPATETGEFDIYVPVEHN